MHDGMPVHLSADGITSMILPNAEGRSAGGLIMLYMRGCPHCEAIFRIGDPDCTIAQLARSAHAARTCIVGVANGPRLRDELPAALLRGRMTFPAIYIVGYRGEVVPYENERTVEAMVHAITEVCVGEQPVLPRSRWEDTVRDADARIEAATGYEVDEYGAPALPPAAPEPARLLAAPSARQFMARPIAKLIVIDAGEPGRSEELVRAVRAGGLAAFAVARGVAARALSAELMDTIHELPELVYINEDGAARVLDSVSRDMRAAPAATEDYAARVRAVVLAGAV